MEMTHIPDCQAAEAALCDYLDGLLTPEERAGMRAHLAACPACAAYERDVREAMEALGEAEPTEAPPILVNKILFQIPAQATGWRGWLGRFFEPVMQPRVVMGAMMTVLSLAMMTRCAGVPSRSLSSADLDPVKIWGAFEDRVHRAWDRSSKAYESLRVVYEVRSRVSEWRQEQEEQNAAKDAAVSDALKSRAMTPKSGTAPAAAKPDKQQGESKKEVGK